MNTADNTHNTSADALGRIVSRYADGGSALKLQYFFPAIRLNGTAVHGGFLCEQLGSVMKEPVSNRFQMG